jgi:hypothetical protein
VFRISVPETNLHHHQVNLIPSVRLIFWRFSLSPERLPSGDELELVIGADEFRTSAAISQNVTRAD